jgi:hypothetical protein
MPQQRQLRFWLAALPPYWVNQQLSDKSTRQPTENRKKWQKISWRPPCAANAPTPAVGSIIRPFVGLLLEGAK